MSSLEMLTLLELAQGRPESLTRTEGQQSFGASHVRAAIRGLAAFGQRSLLLVVLQSLTFVQMYTMQVAGARAMADLRGAIFAFFQKLRLSYYDRTPVGRLVTRATSDG